MRYLYPNLKDLVIPYGIGKDARDLESLVDGVYVHQTQTAQPVGDALRVPV